MIVVLVHWKIHRHEVARQEFFKYWKEKLAISDRTNLVGEYLSEPLTLEQAGFPCSVMNVPLSAKYDSFFNVGLWNSKEDFDRLIVKPYVTSKPKSESFEYEYRERMILSPASWRAGQLPPPTTDSFSQSSHAASPPCVTSDAYPSFNRTCLR